MTTSKTWEQWQGTGFPADRLTSVIYFYPGRADIESAAQRDKLALEIQQDGIAPTNFAAHIVLEDAIVVHGQVVDIDGELSYYQGGEDEIFTTFDATWVELDEYED